MIINGNSMRREIRMKKFTILALAALLVIAMTIPAAALENIFGGYFRTRAFMDKNFTGEDETEASDVNRIDTRTRLFYTAKFSDNLKFVNAFEMNAVWGGSGTYGQMGADGDNLVVKHSYVDFKLAEHRFVLGVQDFLLARGYLYGDDGAGLKAIFKVSDAIYIPYIYIKSYEGGYGKDADDFDVDAHVLYPTIYLSKETTLKPHVAYLTSDDYSKATTKGKLFNKFPGATELDAYTVGLEFDMKQGVFAFGATGIYEFGDLTVPAAAYGHDKLELGGYLFDIYGAMAMGPANFRAKAIYASGNDETSIKDGNIDAFFNPGTAFTGASYYWAEIMGYGIFDATGLSTADDPAGGLNDKISNRIIGNLGVDYKILPSLKTSLDLYYAMTAEDVKLVDGTYGDTLGLELDLVVTYKVVDNLNLDLVAAYLWADDVVNKAVSANNSADPYELGARLSLAF